MSLWIIWLIAALVLLILELLTQVVAALCISVGCIVALFIALIGMPLTWQIIAMAAGVILSFVFIAPLINRHNGRRPQTYNSNMDALIGREGFLTEDIGADGSPGRVRIDGDYWQARTADGIALTHGSKVRIINFDSIILIVEPV